jgi:hypothetical protein
MSRKKISTTIYVTPEQSEKLRLLHERTKVPVAVYIREGIDLVLRQYNHLLPGQLPLASTPHDVTPAPPVASWSATDDMETPRPPSTSTVVDTTPERAAGASKA